MTKAKQLKQDKRNYRKHSERNKELIRKSIDEAGFGRSVVVDADDVLVCGNGVQSVIDPDTPTRIIETDGSELIVVKRTDLHEGDERRNRLAMADNATADHVEWDMEMLARDFDMEEIGRFDIEFDFGEEAEENKEAQEDDFDEEKDDVKTVCKNGDIWQLGQHRLMCGDSTSVEQVQQLMGGGRAG